MSKVAEPLSGHTRFQPILAQADALPYSELGQFQKTRWFIVVSKLHGM